MATFGYIMMVAALAVSLYGTLVPHIGVRTNNWNLIRSVQIGSILNFILVSLASGALIYCLVVSDFSVEYVWQHSSTDLPIFYKVTAFWGGMDGSLLLWALVQSCFTMIVAYRYQYSNREILPYVLLTLNVMMTFLLFLLVGWSNPLAIQTMVPMEGRGLNPLLQHPAMVAHPPSLYLGYIGLSVPFAFAMGAMMRGKVDNQWVMTTRRWTLVSWYFLSLGLILGGQWAYEELGWGGYWAWDPVENAAFMPWLVASAFLHSVMIQEKRNMLKVWNIVLVIIAYALSVLGTFITRSGVLNSVHAFAQSEIGPAFLVFLAIMLIFAFTLLFMRMQMLESEHKMESVLCKENAFLAQNIIFVGMAFTVLLGTTFPLLAEAIRGTKLSIQAPFFNTIITPLGCILALLMGVGTLLAWRRSSLESLKRNFLMPILVAIVLTAISSIWAGGHPLALIVIWITMFVTATIMIELGNATRIKSKQMSTNYLSGLVYVIMRNRRRYGGLIIHLGMVFMFIGLTGRLFTVEKDITLEKDQKIAIGQYELVFKGVEEFQVRNATHRAASIEVWEDGKMTEILKPAKSFYPTQPDPLTEVAIRRSLMEDLYLVFSSENATENSSVTLKIFINPLVLWAWMSLPCFTLGIGICLSYRPKSLVQHESVMRSQYISSTV
ncbi:MAG: heme lyase CcmF/NrfE family subunit [SAR324 cluster bacterium]|nr:heme lyase CcmF/NrfE family subunit [SAR324 cluster bacterium]